jgi:hypothetical protein
MEWHALEFGRSNNFDVAILLARQVWSLITQKAERKTLRHR